MAVIFMSNQEPWWEKSEIAQWKAEIQEPVPSTEETVSPTLEKIEEPLAEIPEPPEKGTKRYYRIRTEWIVIGIIFAWALLNAFDFGPSFYRFYRIGGTEFLIRATFSAIVAYLGSHNRHSPLLWWCVAFSFPPVTLVYLIFYNHLRKTETMWRRNDLIFGISCMIYASASIWIDSLLYRAIIYSCCILAALTAAIAEDKEKNPLVWWLFGLLLFPVAFFCAILAMPADKDLLEKSKTKICPICGDFMPAKFKTCRFCGHIFEKE